MGYAKEFDASKITVPSFLLNPDWADVSYHNDVCPRFENSRIGIAVWVDFDDPALRDFEDWKKFTVVGLIYVSEDENALQDEPDFCTDDAEKLEEWIALYETHKYLEGAVTALNNAPKPGPDEADGLIELLQRVKDRMDGLKDGEPAKEPIKKVFLCIWGEGYIQPGARALVEEHTLDFFTEALGYKPEHLADIDRLYIGGSLNIPDLTSLHSVVCIY